MSEIPKAPQGELFDIAYNIAAEYNTRPVDSSARFKLAKESSVDVFIQDLESTEKHRFIIAQETPTTGALYQRLFDTGIPQFKRIEIQQDRGICVYELPIHAKPLPHEQFAVDRASSETHVSDIELFWQLGTIWSHIYKQTKRLPSSPMRATALLNTEDAEKALVPIPPYDDWRERYESDRDVAQKFVSAVRNELYATHPDTDIEALVSATQEGWRR